MRAGEVIVYVEGPSDRLAMEALLQPLIQQKYQDGVIIKFFPAPLGHNKESVITKVPRTAVNVIRNNRNSIVIAMPDLYPRDVIFEHETFDEMEAGILEIFDQAFQVASQHRELDDRLREHFRVFCFKYDLEALILASEKALRNRLGVDHLDVTWRIPVEDQDHSNPPKGIVEQLFEKHGQRYQNTVDARSIMGASDYRDIAKECPQCFKPFVEFLSSLEPVECHS
jgi:phenylpyruvate tautomerase PptA (4-oxalocrotonate tautomerase family)